jgi:hypothetical protein
LTSCTCWDCALGAGNRAVSSPEPLTVRDPEANNVGTMVTGDILRFSLSILFRSWSQPQHCPCMGLGHSLPWRPSCACAMLSCIPGLHLLEIQEHPPVMTLKLPANIAACLGGGPTPPCMNAACSYGPVR